MVTRRYLYSSLMSAAAFVAAFDPGTGKWKLDDKGAVVMKDGNPVYLTTDGAEQTIDGGTISRLNGEAMTHRKAKETAEASLKKFEGLDPEAARKAIETVGKIDAKKLIDAGEVDKVRAEISGQYTAQIAEKDKALASAQGTIDQMTLGIAFTQSEFVRDRIAIPSEIFQGHFGKHFKVEEGKIVPFDASGNKLFSKTRMGETANFEEAITQIVETYPHKDTILKAKQGGGSGNNGNGGNNGNRATISRSDFEKLSPAEAATAATAAREGKLAIV